MLLRARCYTVGGYAGWRALSQGSWGRSCRIAGVGWGRGDAACFAGVARRQGEVGVRTIELESVLWLCIRARERPSRAGQRLPDVPWWRGLAARRLRGGTCRVAECLSVYLLVGVRFRDGVGLVSDGGSVAGGAAFADDTEASMVGLLRMSRHSGASRGGGDRNVDPMPQTDRASRENHESTFKVENGLWPLGLSLGLSVLRLQRVQGDSTHGHTVHMLAQAFRR